MKKHHLALIGALATAALALAGPASADPDHGGVGFNDAAADSVTIVVQGSGSSLGNGQLVMQFSCEAVTVANAGEIVASTTIDECYYQDSQSVKHSAVVPITASGVASADGFAVIAADGDGQVCARAHGTYTLPVGKTRSAFYCTPV